MKVKYVNGPDGKFQGWAIRCPACKTEHLFDARRWNYNGNPMRPSFMPPLNLRVGVPEGEPGAGETRVCHLVVTNGVATFQRDCTHALAGKIVALADFDS